MISREIPPLGLKPRYLVEEERLHEIFAAIMRYRKVNKEIPESWIEEFNELIQRSK